MEVVYTDLALEDRNFWKKNNRKFDQRIDLLIDDIKRHSFIGLGKPEPLKYKYSGYWSRRISREHRIIYKVADNTLYIVQCRYHY